MSSSSSASGLRKKLAGYLVLMELNEEAEYSGNHVYRLALDPEIANDRTVAKVVREMAGEWLGYVAKHKEETGKCWWYPNHKNIRSLDYRVITNPQKKSEATKQLKEHCLDSLCALHRSEIKVKVPPFTEENVYVTGKATEWADAVDPRALKKLDNYDALRTGFMAGVHWAQHAFGLKIIPEFAKYVAQTSDGKIIFFEKRPTISIGTGKWETDGRHFILEVDFTNGWEHSVRRLK